MNAQSNAAHWEGGYGIGEMHEKISQKSPLTSEWEGQLKPEKRKQKKERNGIERDCWYLTKGYCVFIIVELLYLIK